MCGSFSNECCYLWPQIEFLVLTERKGKSRFVSKSSREKFTRKEVFVFKFPEKTVWRHQSPTNEYGEKSNRPWIKCKTCWRAKPLTMQAKKKFIHIPKLLFFFLSRAVNSIVFGEKKRFRVLNLEYFSLEKKIVLILLPLFVSSQSQFWSLLVAKFYISLSPFLSYDHNRTEELEPKSISFSLRIEPCSVETII